MNGQEITMKFDELLDITKQSFATFLAHTEQAIREERPLLLAVDEEAVDPDKLALDVALVRAAPVAVVPMHSEFQSLEQSGHRFLMARDGMYLEVRRPWLHVIHQLATQTAVCMPYGAIEAKVEFGFGKIGTAIEELRAFGEIARLKSPIESAASVIWNDETGEWAVRYPLPIGEPTTGHIQFQQVLLAEREHLAIDLHSHGLSPAYFSPTDDQDDAGAVKISGVFGNLDQPVPTVAFRLCLLGLFIPITVPAAKIFEAVPAAA